jgi:hypothetical protein
VCSTKADNAACPDGQAASPGRPFLRGRACETPPSLPASPGSDGGLEALPVLSLPRPLRTSQRHGETPGRLPDPLPVRPPAGAPCPSGADLSARQRPRGQLPHGVPLPGTEMTAGRRHRFRERPRCGCPCSGGPCCRHRSRALRSPFSPVMTAWPGSAVYPSWRGFIPGARQALTHRIRRSDAPGQPSRKASSRLPEGALGRSLLAVRLSGPGAWITRPDARGAAGTTNGRTPHDHDQQTQPPQP